MNFKFVFFLYLYLCLWKALQQSEGIVKEGDFLLAFQSRAEAKSEGLSGFRPKAASPPFCSTNFPKGSSWFFVIQQSYYTAASTIVNVSTKNLWFKLYSKVGGLKPILMSIERVEDETKYIFVSSRTKMSTFIICEGQANFYIQYVYPCWFDTLSMCITIKKAKKDQSSVSIQILYKEYNISDDAKYLALYLLKIHLLAHLAWCTVHTHISYCQLRHCPASIGEFGQRKSKLHKKCLFDTL